jgi:hypothetical protein
MSAPLLLYASISIVVLLLVLLFLWFCSSNIFSKAITTTLVLLTGAGGSKITPEYKGKIVFKSSMLSVDGDFTAGGSHADSGILLIVLGFTFFILISSYSFLKYHKRI